jgi:peroxiredoxin Q/BCP
VGVSSDSIGAHRRFTRNYDLPFILLSDRDGAVRKRYGVEKTLGILPGRVTYVIDRTGVVRHIYSSQIRAARHSREALAALAAMADGAGTRTGGEAP